MKLGIGKFLRGSIKTIDNLGGLSVQPISNLADSPEIALLQASEGEAQHRPFWWIGRIGQADQHLHCG